VSALDRLYVVSFAGEPPERTLREFIRTAGDGDLADIVAAIAAFLALRGRGAEARALFAVERLLHPPRGGPR
jgi:hypothetical protein